MHISRQKLRGFLKDRFGLAVRKTDTLYAYQDANLRVRTGTDDYFLKIHKYDGRQRIQAIVTLMDHLAEQGVPVARPLPDRTGNAVLTFEGKSGFLQPFVKAKPLEGLRMTRATARNVGHALGALHKASRMLGTRLEKALESQSPWLPQNFDTVMQHFAEARDNIPPDARGMIAGLPASWRENKASLARARKGCIHGDFNAANVLMGGRHVKTIIDFSDAAHSWYAADVATALMYLFLPAPETRPMIRDFMSGYRAACDMPANDLGLVPFFAKTRAAVSIVENTRDSGGAPEASFDVLRLLNDGAGAARLGKALRP